jgi:hypothetical protein
MESKSFEALAQPDDWDYITHHYKVLNFIGKGAYGHVYKIKHRITK